MLEILAAWRGLRKQRGGIALAILTLAVASCAMVLVFTVVNAVLLRPLPLREAGRLAIVWEKRQSEAGKYGVSGADFYDWQRGASRSVEWMIAQDEHPLILGGSEPENVLAALSTPGMLETFGVTPVLGSAGGLYSALLSYGLWQRRFGGDRSVIGKTITLSGGSYEVAGVLPADFRMYFGRGPADVYIPLEMPDELRQSRDDHSFLVTARLRDGATFQQLGDDLAAVNARLQSDFPKTNKGHDALVAPLGKDVTESARPALLLLLCAASLLMLLACANVANLLLTRNAARANDFAIRQALGASWVDGAKLVLAESLMLTVAAGVMGLIVAQFALPLMRALVPKTIGPVILPGLDHLEVDWMVVLFCAGVCGLMALLGAVEPLRRLRRARATGISRWPTTRAQRVLAVAQVAIACALLTSAVALMMSFGKLMAVTPGFAVEQRQVVNLTLSGGRGERILESVAGLAGVRSVALASIAPGVVGGPRTGIRLATDPPAVSIEAAKKAFFRVVSPGLLRTAGIRVLRGREFTKSDAATGTRAMIVSRTLASRYFGSRDVMGQAMVLPFDAQPWTVVGIADDVHQLGLDKDAYPEMYIPLDQWSFGKLTDVDLMIEAERPVSEPVLRRTINAAEPAVAIGKVRTASQLVEESTASRYFQTVLMGGFSAVAVFVALCGLYSLIAYLVEVRRREIAVRMAVGATPAGILRMVAREGAVLGVVGCAIGAAAALGLQSVIGQFLFGVSPDDPWIFAGVAGLLVSAAVFASIVPGMRASRMSLAEVLRGE